MRRPAILLLVPIRGREPHGVQVRRRSVTNAHDEAVAHEEQDLADLDGLALVVVARRLQHDRPAESFGMRDGLLFLSRDQRLHGRNAVSR